MTYLLLVTREMTELQKQVDLCREASDDLFGDLDRWLTVHGKGDKDRRVPLDRDVAAVLNAYLLTERPDSDASALFLVAKGPTTGRPLTPAGLRTIFRYHRATSGVPAGAPHALRHTFGTALA